MPSNDRTPPPRDSLPRWGRLDKPAFFEEKDFDKQRPLALISREQERSERAELYE